MFEIEIYNKLSTIQAEIAEMRKIYGPYMDQELKDALGMAHTKIDTAADLAEVALPEPYAEGQNQ